MAQFKRGQSGNPDGKIRGTLNITTREAREILNRILFAQIVKAEAALNEIYETDKLSELKFQSGV